MTKLTLTLPDDLADFLHTEAKARGLTSEGVALEALRDFSGASTTAEYERYLRDEIVPIAEEMESDLSAGIPIDEVRARFRVRHAEALKRSA